MKPNAPSPYATQYTITGVPNMKNNKPYRTKAQKQAAKDMAVKTKGGYYVSGAPRSYHKT